jgi:hypothetical protein
MLLAALVAALWAAPAQADEIFGGLYVHDIQSPLSLSNVEHGVDVHLGWRGDPLTALKIQPHAFVSVNSAGDTHYAAVGISRKFGDRVYIRPGVGIAVHTGSAKNFQDTSNDKIEFGSRVLFEPELGVGVRVNRRMTVEASLVHLSHAQLFGKQNPGLDTVGVRLNYKL